MVLLADQLDDNTIIHQVYPLLADDAWPDNLRRATMHIRSLRESTTHPETRDACQWLLAAFASLELLPERQSAALLIAEQQRDSASIRDPATSVRERNILRLRLQLLQHRLSAMSAADGRPIPRIVHLVKTDPRTDDLPLLQYLCYRSILARCDGYRIILHTPEVPQGPRWVSLLGKFELNVAAPPQFLGSTRIAAAAHQSDVWRLQQLLAHGGFYFDWDLLLLRSPEHLRNHVCVMAPERQEPGYRDALGVSAIGAAPASQFLAAWLDAMPASFRPPHYVSHSTFLARRLALAWPSLVRVLPYRAFYYPGWSEAAMRFLFDPAACLPDDELHEHMADSMGIHLFCSHANFVHWARHMTEQEIAQPRCNLAKLMRPNL